MLRRRNVPNTAGVYNTANIVSSIRKLGPVLNELSSLAGKGGKSWFGGPSLEEIEETVLKARPKASKQQQPRARRKESSTVRTVAPVSTASQVGASFMRLAGSPQLQTEQTGNNKFGGVRVNFQDVLNPLIFQPSLPPIWNDTTIEPFKQGDTSIGYHHISPGSISSRLAALEDLYEFYAFREVTFEYVPFDNTSVQGTLQLGFMRDIGAYKKEDLSIPYIMQTEGASSGQVWNSNKVTLRFKGTKLWTTRIHAAGALEESILSEYIQSILIGGLTGVQTTELAVHGYMRVYGTVDFYREASNLRSGSTAITFSKRLQDAAFTQWLARGIQDGCFDFKSWREKYGEEFAEHFKDQEMRQIAEYDEHKE